MDNNNENENNNHDDQHGDDLLDSLGKRIEEANNAQNKKETTNEYPGIIALLPELLQEMHTKGVPFSIDGSTGHVVMDGFYKSGPIMLLMDDDLAFEAVDKKGRKTPINSYDDIIKLNYSCWKATIRKNSGSYVLPSKPWIDEFYQRNLIKRQYVVVPLDDTDDDNDE